MKKRTSFLLLILLVSCAKSINNDFIVGVYNSEKGNRIKATLDYHLRGKIYSRNTLEIKNDSTFVFMTCGNIVKGNWKVSNDSLLLFVKQNRFRIDSLNYSKKYSKDTVCSNKKPKIFIIYKNKLREIYSSNGKKVYSILEKQK